MNITPDIEKQFRQKLTSQQYNVLRNKATEAPFTGVYLDNKDTGVYKCAACGAELFSSTTKYDSGSGWPSFWAGIDKSHLILVEDNSLGMARTEVKCAKCDSHLGHVFNDGPNPTGERYCINSCALDFEKSTEN